MYTRIIFFHKNLRVRNIIIRIYIDGVRSVMCVNKTFNFLNMVNKEYYTKYFVVGLRTSYEKHSLKQLRVYHTYHTHPLALFVLLLHSPINLTIHITTCI